MVRCKLKLSEIHAVDYSKVGKRYVFTAVYDATIPEDVRFAKASPSGKFEIFIDNPAAQAQFEMGQYYYFDASPVPVVETAAK